MQEGYTAANKNVKMGAGAGAVEHLWNSRGRHKVLVRDMDKITL